MLPMVRQGFRLCCDPLVMLTEGDPDDVGDFEEHPGRGERLEIDGHIHGEAVCRIQWRGQLGVRSRRSQFGERGARRVEEPDCVSNSIIMRRRTFAFWAARRREISAEGGGAGKGERGRQRAKGCAQ